LIGVINASPLIYLGKIGTLDLLNQLFTELWTVELVKTEVLQKEHTPERVILEDAFATWLQIQEPQNKLLVSRLEELQLHRGESSIIALAKELINTKKESVVIIDDLAARDVARTMGILITGTIGILLRAVKKKLISIKQSKRFLRLLLEETNFRMSIQLYSQLLGKLDDFEEKNV